MKMRGKSGKKPIFDQKILTGLRVRKTDKKMETSCIAALDTQTA